MTAAALILAAALASSSPDTLALPASAETVAVYESGTKYHAPRHRIAGARALVTRARAEGAGFTPCRPCYRPRKVRPFDRLQGGSR